MAEDTSCLKNKHTYRHPLPEVATQCCFSGFFFRISFELGDGASVYRSRVAASAAYRRYSCDIVKVSTSLPILTIWCQRPRQACTAAARSTGLPAENMHVPSLQGSHLG
jgi:hypothetical protein